MASSNCRVSLLTTLASFLSLACCLFGLRSAKGVCLFIMCGCSASIIGYWTLLGNRCILIVKLSLAGILEADVFIYEGGVIISIK